MRSIATSLTRTCAAVAVRNFWGRPASAPPLTRCFASEFQPPEPPGTHGTPVFSDIQLDNTSETARERNEDPNAVFVVTGASRGLGLQFVKSLLTRTKILPLDLEEQSSIDALGATIKDDYDRVDALWNVAGILGDAKTTPGPERSLSKMNRDWFEKTMAVNLIGPVMLANELYPLIIQRGRNLKRPRSVVANLSARVGSISDNGLGGWYSYRMSKTALNQATRTTALELKRYSAFAIALHPGTTDTDLSHPFHGNVKEGSLFPVEFTVDRLLKVVDAMEQEHSGGFYDWAGKAISF